MVGVTENLNFIGRCWKCKGWRWSVEITAKENFAGYNFTSSRIISEINTNLNTEELKGNCRCWYSTIGLAGNYSEVGWLIWRWYNGALVRSNSYCWLNSTLWAWRYLNDGHTIVKTTIKNFIFILLIGIKTDTVFVDDVFCYTYNPSQKMMKTAFTVKCSN